MLSGVGPTGTALIVAKATGPIAGAIIEDPVTVVGTAAPEANGSVGAKLLGGCHQEISHHLIVKRGGGGGPVQVRAYTIMIQNRGCDFEFGKFFVHPLTSRIDIEIWQRLHERSKIVQSVGEPVDRCLRCFDRPGKSSLGEGGPDVQLTGFAGVGEVDHDLEGYENFRLLRRRKMHNHSVHDH